MSKDSPQSNPFADPSHLRPENPFQSSDGLSVDSDETRGLSRNASAASWAGYGPSTSEMDVPLNGSDPEKKKPSLSFLAWAGSLLHRSSDQDDGPRFVYLNQQAANQASNFADNHISTTKYNAFTFLPKFLFEQFSKYSNLFFLLTAIIQQVPNVSPTNKYTTVGTLLVVLLVSAVKESIEDVKRAKADSELNKSSTDVLINGQFVPTKWNKVAVGDIVRVKSEEPLPADIVIFTSSEPEGLCYVETANLDGETNLKIKQARSETSNLISPEALSRVRGVLESEPPNSSLYTYEATLKLENENSTDVKQIPLSPDQLLLRGATLRNTPWVHGIVVFTGHETKLMRNATATPIKTTSVDHIINQQTIALFALLIFLSVISSMGDVITLSTKMDHLGYLELENYNKAKLFFQDILTYWILYSNLVPISMFVTVECVKLYQAYLIGSDLDIYYEETDTPTVCRTSSLVEELGQVEYIFSDKTGTLTRNIMEFRCCSIAGRCYIQDVAEDRKAVIVDGIESGFHTFQELEQDKFSENGGYIREFLTLLASCHTVIPEVKDDTIKYQAASPDEGALVQGAKDLGYEFIIRRPKTITVKVDEKQLEYELLNICEFNSTRKRMSAIFRCPDGRIRIYCKGADTVILERLVADSDFVEATSRHLEDFAADGLRTLCLAMRIVAEEEYIQWSQLYEKASTTLVNRSEELEKVAEIIEKDFHLLGATAIEDKLQDGVPETIHTLQTAGIKIWILTGDRQETAINIGLSCKLLSEDMNLLIVNEETKEATKENIRKKVSIIQGHQLSTSEENSLALVIDGKSLGYALEPDIEEDLLELGVACKAVICCRVSPLQKALVVKLVKKYKKKSVLLSIGDGANDVSMIQAAHVGVGISGMEGMQAARSADVAIGQFKYLRKLLLVHGAWSYHRLSQCILYSFYKNIVLYLTQFWFVFHDGFSGQSIYESWTLTFYNVFFTVFPPFVMGVFDQFVNARLLDRYPQLYQLGQKGQFLTIRGFWGWIINGVYHSFIIYVGSFCIYSYGAQRSDGLVMDHWAWGVAAFTACVFTALGKAALVTTVWTKFTVLSIPGSIALWLVLFPIYAIVAPLINVSTEYEGIVPYTFGSWVYWACSIVLPALCLLRDIAWKYYRRMYRPAPYHYVQEIQKFNIADYRPRMEQFQKAIRKVRQVQRMRKQRGFAFSQADEGQERIIRAYDTTQKRGIYGEMRDTNEVSEF